MEPEIRLSDTDRETVATRLRDAFAEGRLEIHEFTQRLDLVYGAKTASDLSGVTADLPAVTTTTTPARTRTRHRRRIRQLRTYLGVNVMLWGIWGIQEANGTNLHNLWPLWVTVPWGVAILFF